MTTKRPGERAGAGNAGPAIVAPARLDPESRAWLDALHRTGPAHDEALERLHTVLVGVARFRLVSRTAGQQLRGEQVDDVAIEAANDALVAILARLDDFRGASRFTTWACKFAILTVSDALSRRVWKSRELPLGEDSWSQVPLGVGGPEEALEQHELLDALRLAIREGLTDQQRLVFVAVALNAVPIDVVAEKLGSTRGAVYKTLHDARRKLRLQLELAADGVSPVEASELAVKLALERRIEPDATVS